MKITPLAHQNNLFINIITINSSHPWYKMG